MRNTRFTAVAIPPPPYREWRFPCNKMMKNEFLASLALVDKFIDQISNPKLLISMGVSILQIVVIFIGVKLILKSGDFLLDKIFEEKDNDEISVKRRNRTLRAVLKSTLKYSIYFLGGTMSLEIVGVPTTSILAGAGIVGLAVGFGAQNLVRDIFTGFFILFEKQFSVGDYIRVVDIDGIVQETGLRVTKIKNFDGDLHIIPNGKIERVTNLSTYAKRIVIDVPIDYMQSIQEAIEVLDQLSLEIKKEYNEIKEGPTVLGVQELGTSSVNIRIAAKVEPMESWKIARVIRQRVKEKFDEIGINIPYNHLVIVNKN